jgi:hypothetical protein
MADYTRYNITEQEVVELEVFDSIRSYVSVMKDHGVSSKRIANVFWRASSLDHLDSLVALTLHNKG